MTDTALLHSSLAHHPKQTGLWRKLVLWGKLGGGAVLLAAILGSAAPARADAPTPASVIKTYQAGLISVMKQGKVLGYDGRAAKLAPIVATAFDLSFIARRAAGPYWRKMTPDQQKRYAAVFRKLSIAQHAARFKGFGGETFKQVGVTDPGRGYRLVKTVLTTGKGKTYAIDYLLGKRGGAWKVVDVFTKGTISEVATRRSEFSAILKNQGADALIKAIEGKISREKAG